MKHYIVVTIETHPVSETKTAALISEIAANLQSVVNEYDIINGTVADGGAVDKHYKDATTTQMIY